MNVYKAFLVLLGLSFFTLNSAIAQAGEWVWMNGDTISNDLGNFGTQGIPGPANTPPGLYEACEWTDLNGNFWLFGGLNFSSGIYGALWKYNPVTNEWTWMTGLSSVSDPGSYGTQGVPSTSNRPPARSWGALSWVDLNGNLWMFGGGGPSEYSDLWKYDILSNEWTWMKGPDIANQPGVYGIKGVPDTANNPAARSETAAAWTDNTGNLWLFGGGLYDNDLWRFNVSTNQWTWIKGSQFPNDPGHYGTRGIEDSANTPSARYAHCRWKDKSGNFWLFDGLGSYGAAIKDLWRFNPITNNWTWIDGDDSTKYVGSVYNTKCLASSNSKPGVHDEHRSTWVDSDGNLWMTGGSYDIWNDVWKYCIATNQWVWIYGDTLNGDISSKGIKGVSSPFNIPGGRFGAISWTDRNGYVYRFGGSGISGSYNDLWKYTIDTACGVCNAVAVPPVSNFLASDSTLCTYDCINFDNLSDNATTWQWLFSGATDSTSTTQNPQNICYSKAGIYNVQLIASNSGGSDTLTITNYVTVYPAPPTPVVSQSNDTLFCSSDPSFTYQWYADSTIITSATDTFLVITHGGNYNIKVTNNNGCSIAVGINVVGIEEFSQNNLISLSPNPATDQLLITGNWFREGQNVATIRIFDVLGQETSPPAPHQRRGGSAVIDVSGLPAGIYIVQLITDEGSWVGKFVKE